MSAVDALIQCAGCGRTSPWKPQYAGRRLRCKCGDVIEVRAAAEAHDHDAPEILDEPETVLAAQVAKSPPPTTVSAPANPFDEPERAPVEVAGSAAEPPAPGADDRVSDPDDYGAYGLAPMAAIPITRRPDPASAYNAAEDDNDDDDDDDELLPPPPARGGAVAAMPASPVLGYNSARRRPVNDEEQEQLTSYQRKEMVIPAILIAVGLLATFVQARIELEEFNILAMGIYVAVATVINLVLIFTALLIAAKLLDLGLGELGPALLKIAAVAILPSAIGGIIQASIGFVGGMLAWVVTLGLLFLLLSWLFDMDTQEMMITSVIIWFMRTWVAYFIIMAIFGVGSKDDDSSSSSNAGGGGNTQWVAPAGSGGTGGDSGDGGDGTTSPPTPGDGTTPPDSKPPPNE